jgi:hypothetical protein
VQRPAGLAAVRPDRHEAAPAGKRIWLLHDQERTGAACHVSQLIGGQPGDAVDVEFDQPLGLVGQARKCSEDAGREQSTEQGCSIVPWLPAQLTQTTHAGPVIGIIMPTIDRHD